MRTALRLGLSLVGATAVLIFLLALRPVPATRSLAIWAVLLTAIALRELVRSFPRDTRRPVFEAALRQRRAVTPPPSVSAGMERELELATGFADHAHRRLYPLLRASAAARLSMRHGIELERQPDAARRLLGDEAWDLLRPDRPQPTDSLARGPRREEIAAIAARLEAL